MAGFSPSGLNCALVTPFDGSGAVDHSALKKLIDFLADHQVRGVCPIANIGEFLSLPLEERKRVISTVCAASGGRLAVMPGVCDLNLDHTLELCRFSAQEGASAVLLCAPYYYPYPQEYLKKFLLDTVEGSPLPVVFYNSPGFTNPVDFDTILKLLDHPNVVGMKESSGDLRQTMRILSAAKERGGRVHVLMGWEELLLAGLSHGAKGCIVTGAAIFPELLSEVLASFASGNLQRAADCEFAIQRITASLMKIGFPQGYKLGVAARGISFRILQSCTMQQTEDELQKLVPEIAEKIRNELDALAL